MQIQGYKRLSRWLHWLSAAVILWAGFSGFYLATLDAGSGLRAWISWFNVSLTTAFTPVFALRVVNALVSRKPAPLGVPAWQRRAAGTLHCLLYALTIAVLGSGLLMMDHAINVFDLVSIPRPLANEAWNERFHAVHRYACMALLVLVFLHVAAVIRHQLAGRKVLSRMAPAGPDKLTTSGSRSAENPSAA